MQTINGLGKKARDGTISIDEMAGGTFTISNGGVYGSLLSTPIINPPQSAILGMHSINQRAMVMPMSIPTPCCQGSDQSTERMSKSMMAQYPVLFGAEIGRMISKAGNLTVKRHVSKALSSTVC